MSVYCDSVDFELPDWLPGYRARYQPVTALTDRMAFVVGAARENVERETGGPFGAAVIERDSGELIALGVNLVMTQGLSVLHAEIVAILLAQKQLGHYDLSENGRSYQLVTSCEPCSMCFGAIPWSGIRELVIGARDEDIRAIGFDEGPKLPDWEAALTSRGIHVIRDVERPAAKAVLTEYAERGGHIYNSREE